MINKMNNTEKGEKKTTVNNHMCVLFKNSASVIDNKIFIIYKNKNKIRYGIEVLLPNVLMCFFLRQWKEVKSLSGKPVMRTMKSPLLSENL